MGLPTSLRPLFAVCSVLAGCFAEPQAPAGSTSMAATSAPPTDGRARVVQLAAPQGLRLADGAAWNDAIRAAQDQAMACAQIPEAQVARRLRAIPALHVRLSAADELRLGLCPGVLSITEDRANEPFLTESLPIIDARDASFGGSYGTGQQIAILDTGWFTSAAELMGKVVFEHDTADEDTNAVVTDSACAHGTNVAAIAGGSLGVAADADLLILKVFSDNPAEASNVASGHLCTSAYDTDINEALDLVALEVQGGADVAAVNLSLGGGSFSSACTTSTSAAFTTLVNAGVGVVVAAGNNAFTNAIAYPACDPMAIAVAATYDLGAPAIGWGPCTDAPTSVDQVTCFSNGSTLVDVAAPGALITAGGFTMGGTSQAAPHVAGAFATLRDAVPTATVAEITAAILASPTAVTDVDAGLTYPRLDVAHALTQLATAPVATNDSLTVAEGGSNTVDVLLNDTDPDGAPSWLTHVVTIDTQGTGGTASVGASHVAYSHAGGEGTSDSFTYEVCDGGSQCDTATVSVTITPVNDPPTISDISSLSVDEDSNTGAIAFTIGDAETAASSLTVSRASSNLTLVPTANIVLGGSGTNRTVTITPTANGSGTATITITVGDGSASVTDTFDVIVQPVNDTPTISNITDRAVNEDTTTAPVTFNIGDQETAVASLTVTAASSNQALVPDANLTLTGSTASRTLTATPVANQSGTTTVTVTVSDGLLSASDSFLLTVNAVNDAPTISNVTNEQVTEDTATDAIAFTISDVDDDLATLVVSGTSSATSLLSSSGFSFGGSGANRTVVLSPNANQSGTTAVTLSVSDGNLSASDTFILTVDAVPDAPTLSNVANQQTNEDTASASIAFTVGDAETAAASLTVTASSSNTALVPDTNLTLGGTGASRTLVATPLAQEHGTTTITLTVSDGSLSATDTFVLTVLPVNDPPTISDAASTGTSEDTATASIAYTVGDVESGGIPLVLTGSSSNSTLVPPASFAFSGEGANRSLIITPAANQNGTATITVTVSDGTASATDTFTLTVSAVADPPTISAIADTGTQEDTATSALAFTLADPETALGTLVVSGSSSETTVVAQTGIALSGNGANRTVTLTPVAQQSGTTTITISVSDGSFTVTEAFVLTVSAVNDVPTISNVANQTCAEDGSTSSIAVTLNDLDGDLASLTLSGASSNTALLATGGFVFGGTASARTVVLSPEPNQSGTTTVTLTVGDGVASATDTFVLTVNAVNDPPTVSAVADVGIDEDTSSGVLAFTVADIETAAGALTVTRASTNTTLLPVANIVLGGSGSDRTVTLTPAANQHGTSTVTLTVTDGTASVNETLVLTVNSVPDGPTISDVADRTINEDATTGAVTVTLADADTTATALTLTATSSNTVLLPNASIVLTGTGAARTLVATPAANGFGSATVTLTVSDGLLTATDSFVLDVLPINDGPTISNLANTATVEDTATPPLSVTVTDADHDPATLQLSATSSNTTVAPVGNIVFGGSGSTRTVTLTPGANQVGTSSITLTVTDGALVASDTFTLTVTAADDAPAIVGLGDTETPEDNALGPVPFTVSDQETAATSIVVSASSSNTTLFPTGSVVLGGTGGARTLTLSPALHQHGTATITVSATATAATTQVPFTVTVLPVNDPPTLSTVADQLLDEDSTAGPISFTVADIEEAASSLVVAVTSADPAILPESALSLGGSGGNRTLQITPPAHVFGDVVATLSVFDGAATATRTFAVSITPVNDAPTLSAIAPQVIDEDEGLGPVVFTVDDVDSALDSLVATATCDDPALVSDGSITLSGTGASRTLALQPEPDAFGGCAVTLTFDDGQASTDAVFGLTVVPVNDPPIAIADTNTVVEGQGVLLDLIGNDIDVDDLVDDSMVVIVDAPLHGTLTPATFGFDYAHGGGEAATDTFSYRLDDGVALSEIAWVDLSVSARNDSPVAANDSGTVLEGGTLDLAVLQNDSDAESPLAATGLAIASPPASGTVLITATGLRYQHGGGEAGVDSFRYTVSDGFAGSNEAAVVIFVTPVADAPVAVDDTLVVEEGGLTSLDVLDNDVDPDSTLDTSEITITTPPTFGTLQLDAAGLHYLHGGGEEPEDGFAYRVNDGALASNEAWVSLEVDEVIDPAVPVEDEAEVDEGATQTLDVRANDSIVEDPGTVTTEVETPPAHGTATVESDGQVTYTHDGSEGAEDSLRYRLVDSTGTSATVEVALTILPVNDPPEPDPDSAEVVENSSVVVEVRLNDHDPDSDPLAAGLSIDSPATTGTCTVEGGGVRYTPQADHVGPDLCSVRVCDAPGLCATATLDIEVLLDTDADLVADRDDDDDDGDGITDAIEGGSDSDFDGTPDSLDVDSDGDGTPDDEAGAGADGDGDGTPDFQDVDELDGPDADADGDGLNNATETALSTDPDDEDTDADGTVDGTEVGDAAGPTDSDGDGIIDARDVDDDEDGMDSADEAAFDSDGDGEADPDADEDGTPNSLDDDSDDDGITDLVEGDGDRDSDGAVNAVDPDSDGDERDDATEGMGDDDGDNIPNALDLDDSDGPLADPDGDGLSNLQEMGTGTDGGLADTDGDGLTDGEEVELGTDPTSADTDGDGISDAEEIEAGTDPLSIDSDGDGVPDGEEGAPPDDTGCGQSQVGGPFRSSLLALALVLLPGFRRRRAPLPDCQR